MALQFEADVASQLARADTTCAGRGVKLTDLRRQVLGLVLAQGKPTGAYEILDALRAEHKGAAPPTVYRALDFLLEQGLIHKVESLSAFIGCVHDADDHHHHHAGHVAHAAQFLICRSCGRAFELDNPALLRTLQTMAAESGFLVEGAMIEAKGLCADCRPIEGEYC